MAKIIERTDVEYLRQVGVRAAKQSRIYMNQIDLVLPFSAKGACICKGIPVSQKRRRIANCLNSFTILRKAVRQMAAVSIQNIARSVSEVFETLDCKVFKAFACRLSRLFCFSFSVPSFLFRFHRINLFSQRPVWINIVVAGDDKNVLGGVQIISLRQSC